jgi:hypothetical protein
MQLWVIAVGVSDLQFPIFDDQGQVTGRYELDSRAPGGPPHAAIASVRKVHQWLLERLNNIEFVEAPDTGRAPTCTFMVSGNQLVQSGSNSPLVIDGDDAAIKLSMPKLDRILKNGIGYLNDSQLRLIIVDTVRDKLPDEPIASGVLAQLFMEKRLNRQLQRADRCTILQAEERFEGSEGQIEKRLADLLLDESLQGLKSCVIFPSGGIPLVKDLLPWIFERRFPGKVRIYQEPRFVPFQADQHAQAALVTASQCARQFERGDLAGAKALARLLQPRPDWAQIVINFSEIIENGRAESKPFAALLRSLADADGLLRLAMLIDFDLRAGAQRSALLRLGAFIEMAAWCHFKQNLPVGQNLLRFNDQRKSFTIAGNHHQRCEIKTRIEAWINQLRMRSCFESFEWGEMKIKCGGEVVQWFHKFNLGNLAALYNKPAPNGGCSARDVRNALMHGGDLNLSVAIRQLNDQGVFQEKSDEPGGHFLLRPVLDNIIPRQKRTGLVQTYQTVIEIARGLRAVPEVSDTRRPQRR